MAGSRIKGLTVEIGGDTVKLTSALKDVDKHLGSTQQGLKDVNRLLKLDPSNTELLSQKQKLLKEAVGDTKERLDQLNATLEAAKKQEGFPPDQMDALKREIIETENKLKDLEEQADRSSVALQRISQAGTEIKGAGESITKTGEKLTAGLTVPIVAAGTAAVKTASDFEGSMSQVQATMGIAKDATSELNGETVNTMDSLNALAQQMGATTAFSAKECADAINYLALAGYDTQQMYDTLPTVLNLAAAGAMDLATASDMVTDAMSALGMDTGEASVMVDQMAKTASSTNTSVAQLGEGILKIGGTAKQMAGGTTELNTALGILADNGVKGAEGGTHLRNIIMSLQSPTDNAAGLMEELGLQVFDAEGKMRPLNETLGDLNNALASATDEEKANALSTIFNKTDLASVDALLSNCGDRWDELTVKIQDSGGAAQDMADTQLDNLQGQLTLLKSAVEGVAIAFGNIIMPAIKKVVEKIQGFVDWINNLSDSQKRLVVKIAAVAAAIGPLLIAFGKLTIGVGTLMEKLPNIMSFGSKLTAGIGKLKGFIAGVGTGPLLAVVAAVVAIGGAFATLWNNNEEFRNKIVGTWNEIKEKVAGFCDGIVERLNALGFNFSDITDVIKTVWQGFCDFMAPIFTAVWDQVSTVIGTALDVLTGLFDTFAALFRGDWEGFWTGIGEIWGGFWEGVRQTGENAIDLITGCVSTLLSWFGVEWNPNVEELKKVWNDVWQAISDFVDSILGGIKELAAGFFDLFNGDWEGFCNHLGEAWNKAWEGIKKFGGQIWDGLKKLFDPVAKWFKKTWEDLWNGIKKFFTDIWDSITKTCSEIWDGIKKVALDFWHSFADPIAEAWDAVVKAVDVGIKLIASILDAAFQIITLPFRFIWENCKDTVIEIWNHITEFVGGVWDGIKQKAEEIFGPVRDFIAETWETISTKASEIWDGIKSFVSDTWDAIKQKAEEIFGPIRDFIVDAWNTVSSKVTEIWNGIKDFFTTTWDNIKNKATEIFEGARDKITGAFDTVKNKIHEIWDGLKGWLDQTWGNIKQKAGEVFDGIKQAIVGPIEKAKELIKGIVDKIKGFFDNFHISLPQIKLPHFGIDPPGWQIGDLLKGSIPHLAIDWYAEGGILDGPQIFGANGNTLLGGGEAGKEAVLPLSQLWKQMGKMFDDNSPNLSNIEQLLSAVAQNTGRNLVVVLDSGALVGELAPGLNNAFARLEATEAIR